MNDLTPIEPGGEFLLYQTEDGRSRIEVRMQGETVWPTQNQMAELFQIDKSGISRHLKNIYESGELEPAATVKKFLTVRREGSRQASHQPCLSEPTVILARGRKSAP
ncbi:MAG: hypothetical protein SV487_12715 [Thermodesulfobacteriota bacterium]|nr:hypothetical protein [Thermodesulfobacteriota bacterium]